MTSKGGLHSLLVVPSFPQGGRFITSKTKMKVNTTDMVAKGTVTGSSTSHCDQENTSYCHVHQIDFSLSATQHIYIYMPVITTDQRLQMAMFATLLQVPGM